MNVSTGLKHLAYDGYGSWKENIFKLPVSINSHISSLYEDKFENIWIGTMGNGVMVLDAKTGVYRKLNELPVLSSASILSITGKDNDVWIVSLEGAVHVKLNASNKSIQSTYTSDNSQNITQNVGTNYIYDIYTDSKGRTWFATDGKGIAMLANGKFTHYTQKNGLKSEVIYKIAEDKKGNIWFSTFDAGVIKFNGSSFKYFGIEQGVSDLNITSLASDKHGNILVSHKKGIDIINTNTETLSYLDAEHGINNVNTDLNTLTSDKDGNVYFIANNSIYQYSSHAVVSQPKVLIEKVQLFLNDVEATNGHLFDADEDNISFYFTGLYYSNPERIQYQYKLENYDQDWVTTMDRRKDFPKLPPGTYTFKVRASLNKNFANAQEASLTFTIQKPIWMRWWFMVLAALLLVGILYWYIKDREKRVKKWERLEKEKIQSQFETLRNQVNPHFLFNSFNTLVSEIEDDPKRAVEYVERLSDFFRSIVTYREKDLIVLKEELNIIKDYLFIQRKRYGCAFAVDINITPAQEKQYMIAPLTMQLLAENAVKHNAILKDKPLLLEMFIENDWLIVRNNVNPKMQPEVSTRLGLQNIIKRYELLTGKNVIINKDEKYFTVQIPIIKKL
jgi:streptogramin lyase